MMMISNSFMLTGVKLIHREDRGPTTQDLDCLVVTCWKFVHINLVRHVPLMYGFME